MWIVVIRVRCWDLWWAWGSLLGEVVFRLLGWWLLVPLRGGMAEAVLDDFAAAAGRPLLDNDERMDVDMVATYIFYLFRRDIISILNCWNVPLRDRNRVRDTKKISQPMTVRFILDWRESRCAACELLYRCDSCPD